VTFLAPAMLWLLPLGLLPVVFHLFFRVRRQPRPFSSLLFFLAADPRLSARRPIREWLLLVLRCLLLLSLLLVILGAAVNPWAYLAAWLAAAAFAALLLRAFLREDERGAEP